MAKCEECGEDFGRNGNQRGDSKRMYHTKPGETGLKQQYHGVDIEVKALRIKRDVWFLPLEPSGDKHYAMYPQKLILPCILCGCPEGGVVLDPFMGSGTTAVVAKKHFRKYIGCELNPDYVDIAKRRLADVMPLFEGEICQN